MPKPSSSLYPSTARELKALGSRLKDARLRRRLSMHTVCTQASISRPTLYRIETGDPAVTFGNYLQVLRVLGFEEALSALAKEDPLGRQLQDETLPRRTPRSKLDEGTGSVSTDLL